MDETEGLTKMEALTMLKPANAAAESISYVDTTGSTAAWPYVTTYPTLTFSPSLEHKCKAVLLALVKHVDAHGFVHLESTDEPVSDTNDNTLATHTIRSDESFAGWVERVYAEHCVVRGAEAI